MLKTMLGGLVKEGLKQTSEFRNRPSGLYDRNEEELTFEEVFKHLLDALRKG